MIERHITFSVHPDRIADFERFIAEVYGRAMAASPGFVKVELLRETGSPTRYQLVFRFQDAASATAWRTSKVHEALQPGLKALHDGMEITGYDVVG